MNIYKSNQRTIAKLGYFERGLTLWVSVSIVIGCISGKIFPEVFIFLSTIQYANVNFIVAILIWALIYPMMLKVDFFSLVQVTKKPSGLILSTSINWLIKPFSMAILAMCFFKVIFDDLVSPDDAQQYIAGLIILGAAPCTAMVFVWSDLCNGDTNYTLLQVSVNDAIMVFAFAPIVALLLGVSDIIVPWEILIASVGIYVVVPLFAGVLTQRIFRSESGLSLEKVNDKIKPFSICSLLLIVILLFGFQGNKILDQPLDILLIGIPIIIQSYGIFLFTYFSAWHFQIPFNISAPCALISASNFFELAVAVAISLFGIDSGAALATVVGVLVEVPVMLSLVKFSICTQDRFNQKK